MFIAMNAYLSSKSSIRNDMIDYALSKRWVLKEKHFVPANTNLCESPWISVSVVEPSQ